MWNAIHSGPLILFGAVDLAWYRNDLETHRRKLPESLRSARSRDQ